MRLSTSLVGLIAVAGSIAAAMLAVRIGDRADGRAILPIATLAVAAAPLVRRARARTLDVFEPIVPASLILAAMFSLRPLSDLVSSDFTYRGIEFENSFLLISAVGFAGTAAYFLGYERAARVRQRDRRSAPSLTGDVDGRVALVIAAAYWAIGLLLYSIHLRKAGTVSDGLAILSRGRSVAQEAAFGQTSEYFTAAPILLACVALAFTSANLVRRVPMGMAVVVASTLVPALLFALLGGRRFIIPTLASPVIAAYLAADRRPRALRLAAVSGVALLLLATVPYVRSEGGRDEAGGVTSGLVSGVSEPGETGGRFLSGPDTEMFDALAIASSGMTHGGDFKFGRASLGDVFIKPIPTLLFPKPMTAVDEVRVSSFGTPCDPEIACPVFSAIGSFFFDFHLIGVIVGMLALGALTRCLWERYRTHRSPGWVAIAALTTAFTPILLRADVAPAIAWFLYFAIPTLLALRLLAPARS